MLLLTMMIYTTVCACVLRLHTVILCCIKSPGEAFESTYFRVQEFMLNNFSSKCIDKDGKRLRVWN